MTDGETAPDPGARAARAGFALGVGAVALVVAVVATRILLAHPLARTGVAAVWLSSIGVWVPLVAAVAVVCVAGRGRAVGAGRGARGEVGRAGAAGAARWILPADLAWGAAAGLAARALDALLSVGVTGSTGLSPAPTLGGGPTGAFAVALVVAPVVVAPLVEELFFRGLLQGALTRILVGPAPRIDRLTAWAAAAVVAVVFALVHVLVAPGDPVLLTVGGTFLLGLAAGGVVAATGRVGGAIVAHVVFNGVAVLLTWPR